MIIGKKLVCLAVVLVVAGIATFLIVGRGETSQVPPPDTSMAQPSSIPTASSPSLGDAELKVLEMALVSSDTAERTKALAPALQPYAEAMALPQGSQLVFDRSGIELSGSSAIAKAELRGSMTAQYLVRLMVIGDADWRIVAIEKIG